MLKDSKNLIKVKYSYQLHLKLKKLEWHLMWKLFS